MENQEQKSPDELEQVIQLKDTPAIEKNRNELIKTRADIASYVETPLLTACEQLWDYNIRTLASSANQKDIGNRAYIIIDFNSLSEENQQVALQVGEFVENYDGVPVIILHTPVSTATTSAEIEDVMMKKVQKFQKQQPIWIPRYNLTQMRERWGNSELTLEDFLFYGYVFDEKSGLLFPSEELLKKARDSIS